MPLHLNPSRVEHVWHRGPRIGEAVKPNIHTKKLNYSLKKEQCMFFAPIPVDSLLVGSVSAEATEWVDDVACPVSYRSTVDTNIPLPPLIMISKRRKKILHCQEEGPPDAFNGEVCGAHPLRPALEDLHLVGLFQVADGDRLLAAKGDVPGGILEIGKWWKNFT